MIISTFKEKTGFPILVERIRADWQSWPLSHCYDELISYQRDRAEKGCAWGYFSSVCEASEYPASSELEMALLRSPLSSGFRFCFISACAGAVTASFGGLHLDTLSNLNEKEEIVRLVVNLSDVPREIRFSEYDRFKLETRVDNLPSIVMFT